MSKTVVKKVPQLEPERIKLYWEPSHVNTEHVNTENRGSGLDQIDSPTRSIISDPHKVSCIDSTLESCAGKFLRRYATRKNDPDFSKAFYPHAYIKLRYKTGRENLPQAEKLEEELTSKTFEFEFESRRYRAKIMCRQFDESRKPIVEEPERAYWLAFDVAPTEEVLNAM